MDSPRSLLAEVSALMSGVMSVLFFIPITCITWTYSFHKDCNVRTNVRFAVRFCTLSSPYKAIFSQYQLSQALSRDVLGTTPGRANAAALANPSAGPKLVVTVPVLFLGYRLKPTNCSFFQRQDLLGERSLYGAQMCCLHGLLGSRMFLLRTAVFRRLIPTANVLLDREIRRPASRALSCRVGGLNVQPTRPNRHFPDIHSASDGND